MSTWALIDANHRALEIITTDPAGVYPASMPWVSVPDGTLAGWIETNGTFAAPASLVTPAMMISGAADAARAAGLTITSTSTPTLNGTYSCDATAQQNISSITLYILVNQKFPGSGGTLTWLDKAGTAHVFPNTALFQEFASAVASFVTELTLISLTGSGTLPSSAVMIP